MGSLIDDHASLIHTQVRSMQHEQRKKIHAKSRQTETRTKTIKNGIVVFHTNPSMFPLLYVKSHDYSYKFKHTYFTKVHMKLHSMPMLT